MQFDVPLSETLARLDADHGLTVMVPFAALEMVVSLSAGHEDGTYRVMALKKGEVQVDDTLTGLQLAAVMLPLVRKNESITNLQGRLLALQTENFLKGVASEQA